MQNNKDREKVGKVLKSHTHSADASGAVLPCYQGYEERRNAGGDVLYRDIAIVDFASAPRRN
jgi:hypothetical protein